jgi:hypothetical protein
MSDRRVDDVVELYPSVDRDKLAGEFQQVRTWRVMVNCPSIRIGSDSSSATAACTVNYLTEYTIRPGRQQAVRASAQVRLARGVDRRWRIDRLVVR